MHQMSLGNLHEARGAFETASGLARLAVVGTGRDEVKAGSEFGVVLYAGYLGISRWLLGDPEGRTQYEAACAAFDDTAAKYKGEEHEDSVFGAEQLRWVARKLNPEATSAQR